jgi:hypothetical protein
MAICVTQTKGLSLQHCLKTINCSKYIVNINPIKALKNRTLEQACSKIKLYVSHFHVFGSEVWVHIPNEKMKELKPKSEKCIFLGYFEDVKGYRLLQPHSN